MPNENEFKSYRNKLTDEIRVAKNQYYKNKLNGSAGDAKKTWKVINEVLKPNKQSNDVTSFKVDDKILTDSSEIANSFNEFFTSIGSKLASDIVDRGIQPDIYFGPRCQSDFIFAPITNQEIVDLVVSLSDASAGCDNISTKVVKNAIHEIVIPLKHIFDISLSTGIFPDKLKQSRVTPIFKSGDRSSMNNYRPVSVLSVFSKIIEKLVCNRLETFLNDNNTIYSKQFGFQKLKSTTSALLAFSDYVLDSFDEYSKVAAVFLDFKKAFDTVDHQILLRKLDNIGIRGVAYDWFRSYLFSREQFTKFNNVNSINQELTHSVPQGSILGPCLFNIYINDLVNTLNQTKLILFADDSCLYLAHSNIDQLIKIMNNELDIVNNWMNSNKLTLNLKKSHYLIFSRKKFRSINNIPRIKIDNHILERKTETTFLGVILQSNLKWDSHIKQISSKLNKYSSIMYQIRNNLDKKHLKLLYKSLIYPQLTYANIIWGRSCIKVI